MFKNGGIKNGEIFISKEEWKEINGKYTRDEIIQFISDSIESNKMPLPYRKITREEALTDFERLKNLDTSKVWRWGKVVTKYPYKYPISELYINSFTTGNKASNFFHQKARFRCDSINSPSPYRVWTDEKFRKNMLKSLWTLKFTEINTENLRTAITMRNYIASQFRVSVAKAMYEHMNSKYVMDFSAGWGDRYAAFCAVNNTLTYTGIDPNKELHRRYLKQSRVYGKDKNAQFILSPAEEVDFSQFYYDTVFTSPPYFNVERYTQDEFQSWKRYKKLDIWLEEFLFKTIKNAWTYLQPNGYMAINIADVYTGHKINKICDPMNDFISTLPNASYEGTIGYRMAKRPLSASDKDGVYIEPIWIWRRRA